MNDIRIFQNNDFGEVRATVKNNEAYFMLNDVCRILEIKNVSDTKSRLKKDGVVTTEVIDSLGRRQMANFINESNLYKVIFQSRKPEAEKFTEWVTSEVLPSIRSYGGYLTPDKVEEVLLNPDTIIQLATNLKKEQEKRRLLESMNREMKPKALFADAVETSKSSILIGELAKLIKQNGVDIGQNRLFSWLREKGYLIRRRGADYNTPTQYSMELGLFETKVRTINNLDGSIRVTKTSKVTGKGQIYFINKFLEKERALA